MTEIRMLPDWQREIVIPLMPRLAKLAAEIVVVARELCPEDTGALKDSIDALVENDGTIVLGAHAENAQGHQYAADVEYGHDIYNQYGGPYGHVNQSPFLRPAIRRSYGEI